MARPMLLLCLALAAACGGDDGDSPATADAGLPDAAASADDAAPVGRRCATGLPDGGAAQTLIASPALDCPSRMCLQVDGNPAKCTAHCTIAADCKPALESACAGGFTCAIAVSAGPFCCLPVCICVDDLPGGQPPPPPAACNPADAQNACCNLEGRPGNPAYPLCQ